MYLIHLRSAGSFTYPKGCLCNVNLVSFALFHMHYPSKYELFKIKYENLNKNQIKYHDMITLKGLLAREVKYKCDQDPYEKRRVSCYKGLMIKKEGLRIFIRRTRKTGCISTLYAICMREIMQGLP